MRNVARGLPTIGINLGVGNEGCSFVFGIGAVGKLEGKSGTKVPPPAYPPYFGASPSLANVPQTPVTPGISNLSPDSHQAIYPGIYHIMSGGGASDALSGATSLSREFSNRNHHSRNNTQKAPLAQLSIPYDATLGTYDMQDRTLTRDGGTMMEDGIYCDDGGKLSQQYWEGWWEVWW